MLKKVPDESIGRLWVRKDTGGSARPVGDRLVRRLALPTYSQQVTSCTDIWPSLAAPPSRRLCSGTRSAACGGTAAITTWLDRAPLTLSPASSVCTRERSRRPAAGCRLRAGSVPSQRPAGTCSGSEVAGRSPRQLPSDGPRWNRRRAPNHHCPSPAVAPRHHPQKHNGPFLRKYENQNPPDGGRWFLRLAGKCTRRRTCVTSRPVIYVTTTACGVCCGRRSRGGGSPIRKRIGSAVSRRPSTPSAWAHAIRPGCLPGCCGVVAGASSRRRTRIGRGRGCGATKRVAKRTRLRPRLVATPSRRWLAARRWLCR